MKTITFTKDALVTGENALEYLKTLKCKKAVIITGGQSMKKTGVLDKVTNILNQAGADVAIYSGIGKNPTTHMVLDGLEFVRKEQPDCLLAVGGGSSIDAAKVMLIFYEHPEVNFDNVFSTNLDELEFKTKFVAVPSTSGTASEVTKVSVITFEDEKFKRAIRSVNIFPDVAILDPSLPATLPAHIAAETGMDALTHALEAYINKNGNDFTYIRSVNIFPDVAILDPSLPATLPAHIAAETGMDALTHALEAYINKNGNDFTYAMAKEAIEGIIEWLPVSVNEGTLEAREKMHNFQCMAGMAFANSGLGMVHGVSHAFGGMYNVAHGLANAVILPYSMDYNKKDPEVAKKYEKLSKIIGCDIIEKVKETSKAVGIPARMIDAGVSEEEFKKDFDKLLEFSMQGSTVVNPIKVSEDDMKKFLDCIFYGEKVDF